ncbi:MAG: GNAT family N-acetyltransferase [Burkholderiales bacterium]|nr:GNAT family N-acetyltransferase [Burkholderiales bacterium]
MQLDYLVRTADAADAKRLAVLAMQVWLHTYATQGVSSPIADYVLGELTADKYTALLQHPAKVVLVAEQEDALLGFVVVELDAPCPDSPDACVELATLYVQAHSGGKGIGTALLGQAQALARQRSDSRLWLSVNVHNRHACAFYARRGYRKIGSLLFMLDGVGHENDVLISAPPP